MTMKDRLLYTLRHGRSLSRSTDLLVLRMGIAWVTFIAFLLVFAT